MKCRCTNSTHPNHRGNHCADAATEIDDYCKVCHDKAGEEAIQAQFPTNQPVNIQIRVADSLRLSDSLAPTHVIKFYREPRALVIGTVVNLASFIGGLSFGGLPGAFISLGISMIGTYFSPAFDFISKTLRKSK